MIIQVLLLTKPYIDRDARTAMLIFFVVYFLIMIVFLISTATGKIERTDNEKPLND